MQTKYLLLLALICMGMLRPAFGQGGLHISNGTSVFIKQGTVFSVDSLVLTPSADFTIAGANSLTRSLQVMSTFPANYVRRVYRFATTTAPYNGTIGIYYRDADLNGVPEHKLLPFLHNSTLWNAAAMGLIRSAGDNAVTATNVRNVPLNEVMLAENSASISVNELRLVNADTDKEIMTIKDGAVLDLATLPRALLNIRATTLPDTIGSVVFELSGQQTYRRMQSWVPYALFSDNGGNYLGGSFQPGEYTLTATPYRHRNGGGFKGIPLTIRFRVVYGAGVSQLMLVNATNGSNIQEIKEGDVLDLNQLPAKTLSVRAITAPDTVGSVVFNLSGQKTHAQTEGTPPYALFGNAGTNYTPWAPETGKYTLKVAPYSAPGGRGAQGADTTINFSVIRSAAVVVNALDGNDKVFAEPKLSLVAPSLKATPNPFAEQTIIRFSVPQSGNTMLGAYNVSGQEVARLFQGTAAAGQEHQVPLNGKKLPAGVYVLRLTTGKHVVSIKVVRVQ